MPVSTAQKPTVLFVDDEERILRSLKMLFRTHYDVLTAGSGAEALELLKLHPVQVIVSDQRMPGMLGAELLTCVKDRHPDTLRLLLTGYSDLTATIDSINEAEVFRYVQKPWHADDIRRTLAEAVEIALSTATGAQTEATVQPDPVTPPTRSEPRRTAPAPNTGATGVLVIDDDPATLLAVKASLGDTATLHGARDLDEALCVLGAHDIGVVVTEIRSRDRDLSGAIKALKQQHPSLQTIVLTSFQDTHTLVELINHGQVFRFLPKPTRKGLLELSLKSALQRHLATRTQPRLQSRQRPAPSTRPEDATLSGRIAGYLARLRERRHTPTRVS